MDIGTGVLAIFTVLLFWATYKLANTAVCQLKEQRDHNRRSVKPILDFEIGGPFSFVKVTNKGLGPAIIKSIVVQFADKHYRDLVECYYDKGPLKGFSQTNKQMSLTPGDTLSANNSYRLLDLDTKSAVILDGLDATLWRQWLREVQYDIEFESIYGEVKIARLSDLTVNILTEPPKLSPQEPTSASSMPQPPDS